MRFAICDDSAADRRALVSMLQQYCAGRHVQAEIQPFADGRALLDAFAPGKYQILFLDIYMPALTGMEAAKAIREKDTGCQLVFTTTSEDHALESYGVYAAGYLLKPYTQGQLDETVDWCLDRSCWGRSNISRCLAGNPSSIPPAVPIPPTAALWNWSRNCPRIFFAAIAAISLI